MSKMELLSVLGWVLSACGGGLAGALFASHDPPSGYNMGTGDSWIPFWLAVCVGAFGVALVGWSS